jgi:hypothetical protein
VTNDTDEKDAISSKGGKISKDNWHPRTDKVKIRNRGGGRGGSSDILAGQNRNYTISTHRVHEMWERHNGRSDKRGKYKIKNNNRKSRPPVDSNHNRLDYHTKQ